MTMGEDQVNAIMNALGRLEEGVGTLKTGQATLFLKVDELAVHGCARGDEHSRSLAKLENRMDSISSGQQGQQGDKGKQGEPGRDSDTLWARSRRFKLGPLELNGYMASDVIKVVLVILFCVSIWFLIQDRSQRNAILKELHLQKQIMHDSNAQVNR